MLFDVFGALRVKLAFLYGNEVKDLSLSIKALRENISVI